MNHWSEHGASAVQRADTLAMVKKSYRPAGSINDYTERV